MSGPAHASRDGTSPAPGAHDAFLAARYFPALDGLRCLSIVAVIGFHALGADDPFLGRGAVGVELFFVISGFLITTLLLRERERNGSISLPNFYVRRALRIFPLYYAVLAVYVVMVAVIEPHSAAGLQFRRNLPAFLSYTSNWFVELDGPRVIFYFAWSLATEEQFYLFWPWVVRFARRRLTPPITMAAMLVFDQAMQILIARGVIDFGSVGNRIATSIATPISLGCILAYALHWKESFRPASRLLGHRLSLPVALVAMLAAAAVRATPDLVLHLTMTATVGAACIRPDPGWNVLLRNRVATYLGTISYGMYLLHMIALNAAWRVVGRRPWPGFVAGLALTILAAAASHQFFEKPFLRLKDRWAGARAGPRIAVIAAPVSAPVAQVAAAGPAAGEGPS
ncbi:MAG TPA: acyltransferase [Myxococcales bacterium]